MLISDSWDMKREMGNRYLPCHRVHSVSIKGIYVSAHKDFVQMKAVEQQNMGGILLPVRLFKNKVKGRPCFLAYTLSFLLGL